MERIVVVVVGSVRDWAILNLRTYRSIVSAALFLVCSAFPFAAVGVAATPTAQAPTPSPASGTYPGPFTVTLTSPMPKAYFYYTLDGSTPSLASTWYSGPITLSSNKTIRAVAYSGGYNASAIVSAKYVMAPTAPAPTISPAAGTYTTAKTASISCSNKSATIHYTTNGTTPALTSPVYTGPFTVSATTTISATAVATGLSQSAATVSKVTVTVPAPVFSEPSNNYSSVQTIGISDATAGASIYYTTNGTTPSTSSTLYKGPITVSTSTNFQASAMIPGGAMSAVTKAWFDIELPTPAPVASPPAGTYSTIQTVKLSDAAPGATIHYTLDGSFPTTSSAVYTTAISATSTTTIRAMATAPTYSIGPSLSAVYNIVAPPPSIAPLSGSLASTATVTMTDASPGTSIYYTNDGSYPTTSSTLYTGPIKMSPSATSTFFFRAIAAGPGYLPGPVTVSTFTVDVPAGVLAESSIGSVPTKTIPADFLGLSMNYQQPPLVMGQASTGVNPIFRTLLNNLLTNTSAPMLIRVVADDTQLSDVQAAVEPLAELAQALNVNYTLGVDMWQDNPTLAQQEAAAWMAGIPKNLIQGIEIGNEPDDYAFVDARPSGYSFADYYSELQTWLKAIGPTVGTIGTFGPSFGRAGAWIPNMEADLINGTMTPVIVNQHAYVGGETQDGDSGAPWPLDTLLTPSAAVTMPETFTKYAATAHKAGRVFRMGEINSFWGGLSGISDTFSSSLWSIDLMFNYLANGVDGVNWNDEANTTYVLSIFSTKVNAAGVATFQLTQVNPLYYGLLVFSQIAGKGAQILPVNTSTSANVSVWATVDTSSVVHAVVLNKDETAAGNVEITLPGYTKGTVRYLTAANYLSHNGVTLGGQTFDGSPDGTIQGALTTTTITGKSGVFTVPNLPLTSAAIIDFTE
jgi:hypothetical protein